MLCPQVPGNKFIAAPPAPLRSAEVQRSVFKDLGALFLLDCVLGNPDRLSVSSAEQEATP